MPWFSFHGGHSGMFCGHAKDGLEQVVQRAVAAGFTHYGLSEHAPRFRAVDLVADEVDLTPADLLAAFQRYKVEADALRESHAAQINLFVGFETERLPPKNWVERMAGLRAQGFDYIVASVHAVGGQWVDYSPEMIRSLAEALGGIEALHLAYFDAVAEVVSILRPEVVGHLDLVRKFEPPGFAGSRHPILATDREIRPETDGRVVPQPGASMCAATAGNALVSEFWKPASIFGTSLSHHNAPDQLA